MTAHHVCAMVIHGTDTQPLRSPRAELYQRTSPVTGFVKAPVLQTTQLEPVSILFGGTANVDDPVSE
jgi:hypothetical protein